MSPRVNITYTIDLEKLPSETARLLEEAMGQLRMVATASEHSLDEEELLTLETLDTLTELRSQLAEVDYTLHDVTKIINGYLHYRSTPTTPTVPTEDELSRQLAEFQQNSSS
jgi:hypothetical protein